MAKKEKYVLAIKEDMSHVLSIVPSDALGSFLEKAKDSDYVFIGKNKKSVEKVFEIFVIEYLKKNKKKK